MKNQCFAIVTPSYDLDFARCKLLCQSINYFIEPTVNHYIIVSKKDTALFNQLANQNTQIIAIESIIPAWIKELPWFRQGWISCNSLPIRNWLMQQITKIIVAQTLTQDITVLVDSEELDQFIAQTAPEQVAIMISSKANIPVEFYHPLLIKYFPEFNLK